MSKSTKPSKKVQSVLKRAALAAAESLISIVKDETQHAGVRISAAATLIDMSRSVLDQS